MCFEFTELKNAPAFLKDLGLRAVYVPRQDGWHEHYAFFDAESNEEMFSCNTIDGLVDEAGERKERAGI